MSERVKSQIGVWLSVISVVLALAGVVYGAGVISYRVEANENAIVRERDDRLRGEDRIEKHLIRIEDKIDALNKRVK